jgi:hypothetical protein
MDLPFRKDEATNANIGEFIMNQTARGCSCRRIPCHFLLPRPTFRTRRGGRNLSSLRLSSPFPFLLSSFSFPCLALPNSRTWLTRPAKVVISVPKGSSIEVVRGATTRSCFRLGIPSGHSSGSHSTARAISFTQRSPAAIGGGRRIQTGQGPVRLCSAEQVKYARLQHRLE